MSYTYRGESPAKRLVRHMLWSRCMTALPEYALRWPIIVLGSSEGGDLAWLEAEGGKKVYAAEINRSAAEECARKWPNVEVFNEDVAKTVHRFARVGIVNLDFCGHLGRSVVATATSVLKRIPVGGILCVALLKGREKDDLLPLAIPEDALTGMRVHSGNAKTRNPAHSRDLQILRLNRRLAASEKAAAERERQRIAAFSGTTRTRINAAIKQRVEEYNSRPALKKYIAARAPAEARMDELLKRLNDSIPLNDILSPIFSVAYLSDTRDGKGSPMLHMAFQRCLCSDFTVPDCESIDVNITREDSERQIVSLLRGGVAPSRFNLTPREAAALKAHGTRGTYGVVV